MSPNAIINEALLRQKDLLRDAEKNRLYRQVPSHNSGPFHWAGQLLVRVRQYLKAEFLTRLNTPVFGKR